MPPAVPLIAAAAGSYIAGSAAIGIGFTSLGLAAGLSEAGAGFVGLVAPYIAGFAVSTAIDAVGSRAFASKPAAPNFNTTAISHAVMVKSTTESHKIIYGTARVSGPIVFIATTNSGPIPSGGPATGTNIMLHIMVALAGHEVDSIGTIYLNDKPLTLNGSGYATNLPYSQAGSASVKTISTAARAQDVVTVTTSTSHGFTAGDQVDVAVTSDLSMNGSVIIASTPSGTTFTYANGGPNASATGGTATDNTLSSTTNSYVRVKKHAGAIGQAADSDAIAEIPGWDSNHKLNGIAYVYVRLQYNQGTFTGIPNISAIVNGKKVYDPRSGLSAWSTNAALCVRDYLTSDYGFNAGSSEVNDTYFTAAANHCDESVSLNNGGSQSRYTCNGVIDTAVAPVNNLNALVAAMAGTVTFVQGQFRGYAGVYDSTVGDITTDMLAGPVKIRTRPTRHVLFNAVQGTYVDPNLNWAVTDFPPVTNNTYTTNDGGQQIFKDLQLPLTNHPEASQRIAKVVLEQSRQGIQMELVLNHNALQFAVWDTVTYTDPVYGWDHKVFRIKKFGCPGIGKVSLILQEESSASYNWSSGEPTILDAAPDTNLPNPFTVTVPSGVSFSSRSTLDSVGNLVYNLVLMWTPHEDAFVANGGMMEIQFKLHADSTWRPSFMVSGALGFADLITAAVNTLYDIRIRAISSLGNARSNWVEMDSCSVGSSGGVGTTNDWGSVADAVGPTNDWDLVSDGVGATNDWGSVA
jgi:hypothetical protein